MAANLKRAGDAARWYYPMLMKGEWPVLLNILGKGEGEARYLSVADVRTLFVERQLPDRITARLPKPAVLVDAFAYAKPVSTSLEDAPKRIHHLNSGVPGTKASNAAQNCAR